VVTFGVDLSAQFSDQSQKAPTVVLKCIEAVETRGIKVEGIYRVSSSVSSINRLKVAFDTDASAVEPSDPQWDHHVFASALKLYLRELPEPVFPFSLYNDFISAARVSGYEESYAQLQPLLDRLPSHNRLTLYAILEHLAKVGSYEPQNKMSTQNLAVIFGPTLIRPRSEDIHLLVGNSEFHCRIVEILLLKGSWITEQPVELPVDVGPPPCVRRDLKRPFS